MIHGSIQARSEQIQEAEMSNPAFAKTGFALCLLTLAVVPAAARDGYDFTPREPSLKQSGHWEWAWDGEDGLGVGLVGATVHYVPQGPARIVITGPNEALERVKIGHRARHMPSQLSGGQQQRVAVARAVVARPKLILADEPTGNLDTTNGEEVMQLLTELNDEGTTIAMVTHSHSHAEYAHRIVNLLDGAIVTESIRQVL
jgi:ABC-type hemin transport system ATPase subunit